MVASQASFSRPVADAPSLLAEFRSVRATTRSICAPLETEDFVIQAMADVSPPRWHLAHVTWFFEIFILKEFDRAYRLFNERYPFLFNSYYEHAGERWTRNRRGLLSRPTVREIFAYRAYVDEHVHALLGRLDAEPPAVRAEVIRRLTIGLQHEQQHQELLFMDIKYNFSINPLFPAYLPAEDARGQAEGVGATPANLAGANPFVPFDAGLYEVGVDADQAGAFAYDNETPRHKVYLNAFELARRPVSNGEYLAFVTDGGYGDFRHWLSDGWSLVQTAAWRAPLYWHRLDDAWFEFTLHGLLPLDPRAPVCHLSFFEADAFARWAGARLPTEFEWEIAAAGQAEPAIAAGNLLDAGRGDFRPLPVPDGATAGPGPLALFGDVWEWTVSAYLPYPKFRPLPGALGEYNGKFMNDQRVLRGGSCVTERAHIRPTYRNYFQSDKRWAFSGLRTARDHA